jgi:methionyl aminopeptidase
MNKKRSKGSKSDKSRARHRRTETKRFAEGMRNAGRLAYQILEELEGFIVEGVTTLDIDNLVDKLTTEAGAVSAPFGYEGFPLHCCTSVNEVVCHGVPSEYVLKDGDILNVDVTPKLRGFHGDSSRMFSIGQISAEDQKLIDVTKECLWLGIEAVSPGCGIDVIGHAIEPYARENDFTVVRNYTGHGTGKTFHKDPPIPHMALILDSTNPDAADIPVLKPGTAFTIEPMINAGGWEVCLEADNWTVKTADYSRSAQWEHTMLVTQEGIEVLTDGS